MTWHATGCISCSRYVLVDSTSIDVICSTCIEDYHACYYCEDYYPYDNIVTVGDESYCDYCHESQCSTCEECNEPYPNDSIITHDDTEYCQSCYDEVISECELCHGEHHKDDMHDMSDEERYPDDGYLCSTCYTEYSATLCPPSPADTEALQQSTKPYIYHMDEVNATPPDSPVRGDIRIPSACFREVCYGTPSHWYTACPNTVPAPDTTVTVELVDMLLVIAAQTRL